MSEDNYARIKRQIEMYRRQIFEVSYKAFTDFVLSAQLLAYLDRVERMMEKIKEALT